METFWEPEVPVMVTVYSPRAAVLLAVNVIIVEPVIGFAANEAVTPLGKPVIARLTLPVKPYCGFTETEDVADVPCPRLMFHGPPRVKVGALMESGSNVLAVTLPEVPVTVALYCPRLAELLALNVTVLLPFAVGFGENEAVTPLGRPETAKVTLPLNPELELTITEDDPEPPWPMLKPPPAMSPKLGG